MFERVAWPCAILQPVSYGFTLSETRVGYSVSTPTAEVLFLEKFSETAWVMQPCKGGYTKVF